MKLKKLMRQAENTLKNKSIDYELTPYEKELVDKFGEVEVMINAVLSGEELDITDEEFDKLFELEKELVKKMNEEYERRRKNEKENRL